MRIHISANSVGYRAAEALRDTLETAGHDVVWHAAPAYDEGDDYPAITIRTVQAVVADEDAGVDSRAVLVGGDGAGEVIAANKVNGGRVCTATTAAQVAAARRNADVNGLVVAIDYTAAGDLVAMVAALTDTPFSNNLDDARRLVNVAEFETSGTIEGWMIER